MTTLSMNPASGSRLRRWAIVRFCLATFLGCLAVATLFVLWVRLADADEPGSVVLLVTLAILLAMVVGIMGIFFVLVFMSHPSRGLAERWLTARFCLALALGCVSGIVLFYVWFGASYGRQWGVGEILFTCGVLVAMVLSVVGLFSALVFRPYRPDDAGGASLP